MDTARVPDRRQEARAMPAQCTYTTGPLGAFIPPARCVRDAAHAGPHAVGIAQGPWWGGRRCAEPETAHAYGPHGACYTRHVPELEPKPARTFPAVDYTGAIHAEPAR